MCPVAYPSPRHIPPNVYFSSPSTFGKKAANSHCCLPTWRKKRQLLDCLIIFQHSAPFLFYPEVK